MSLSKLWEIVKDREAGELQFMGSQSQTRLSNWTTTNVIKYVFFQEQHMISLLFSLYVVNHIDWLFDANPGINKLGCAVLSFLHIFTLSEVIFYLGFLHIHESDWSVIVLIVWLSRFVSKIIWLYKLGNVLLFCFVEEFVYS